MLEWYAIVSRHCTWDQCSCAFSPSLSYNFDKVSNLNNWTQSSRGYCQDNERDEAERANGARERETIQTSHIHMRIECVYTTRCNVSVWQRMLFLSERNRGNMQFRLILSQVTCTHRAQTMTIQIRITWRDSSDMCALATAIDTHTHFSLGIFEYIL